MTIHILPDERVCANCRHYHPHHVVEHKPVLHSLKVYCGHCAYPRHKQRKPGDEGCKHWDNG